MRIFLFFVFTLITVLAIPATPRAAEIVPVAQIRPLVEWVEARTNLMLLPRPKIFVSTDALLRLASANRGEDRERIAAYRNGMIFISEKFWQPDNIADQSVLVHELVHAAQDAGGQEYACANQREAEAYRLQNLFLTEHGERPFLDRADLDRLAQCE